MSTRNRRPDQMTEAATESDKTALIVPPEYDVSDDLWAGVVDDQGVPFESSHPAWRGGAS